MNIEVVSSSSEDEEIEFPEPGICTISSSDNAPDIKIYINDHPDPHLYLVQTFAETDINRDLRKRIYEMGFTTPSRIQRIVLPALLANPPQNLLVQAESGTGKTAAFLLAMLNRVDVSQNYPQALCLSPTCELAVQTGEIVAEMAQFCPEIRIRYVLKEDGGKEVFSLRQLTEHVIIGTPGKVFSWAFFYRKFDIQKLTVFILNDVDFLMQTANLYHCSMILKTLSETCQTMLSSTICNETIIDAAKNMIINPITVKLLYDKQGLDKIHQYCIVCSNFREKFDPVMKIYDSVSAGQTLIFCRTRRTAILLAEKMSENGKAVAVFTGRLSFGQRYHILRRFRLGEEKVLITTNILARSINFKNVRTVVNFDPPTDAKGAPDYDTYLQRVGYVKCGEHDGVAINLTASHRDVQICLNFANRFDTRIKFIDWKQPDAFHEIGG